MSQAQVRKEVEQPGFGLKWTETIHVLPRQHIMIFTKQTAVDPKARNTP